MPEPYQEPRFSSNAADGETTPRQPPLGLKDPLLPANVLGQNFLSPKFLSPLGAQPLGAGNALAVPTQALPDYGLSDNSVPDSPFFAESQLSLSNSEPALPVAATPLPTTNSDRPNVQRAPMGNEPENSVDSAASEELAVAVEQSEQPEALVQRADEEFSSQILVKNSPSTPVAVPFSQLSENPSPSTSPASLSRSETTSSSVVQPRLATEHHVQREIATPQAPEATEPIASSVGNPQPSSQMPVSSEQPQAIANTNARQEEVFTKAEADLTSPVPQPALASESETTSSSVVQARFATEPHIQRKISTPQASEAAELIEPSVGNPQPSSEMAVSSEQPQVLANSNAISAADFINQQPNPSAPVSQPALASESETTSSSVVQARFATEHHVQREIATPQAPEATEPIESSVENQQAASEMAVSSEQPQAIANTNDRQEEVFTKAEADLTSPVPQPALASESETTSSSVVQARFATEHHIQREVATPQAPEVAESIEPSLGNQQPAGEMSISWQEPQALAHRDSIPGADFTNAQPHPTPPVEQPTSASSSDTANPTVVQPGSVTEHPLQRKTAAPEVPEAVEPIESSVENQQSASEMPASLEQPQAIASPNAIPAADFINPQLNLSASVSQPGLPSESDVTTPSVVQPRLATEHHIQRETTPVAQDDSVPYSQQQSVEVAKPNIIPDVIHVAPKLEVALPVADPQQAIADSSSPNALTPVTENPVNIPEPAIEQRTSEHDRVSQVAENESLIQQKATEQAIAQPDNSLASARLELGKESATQELSTATPETAPEGQTPTELAVVQPLLGTEASDLNSQVLPTVSDSPQLPESLPSGESIVQSKAVPEIAAPDISSVSPLSDSSGLPGVSEQPQPPESSVTVEATEQTAHDDTKVEAIANSNSVPSVAQGESIVQSKQLPETTAQAAFSTPLPSETEPPSTISEPIIAEPAPVIPNTVPRESSPDSYPVERAETPQSDEKTSLTEPTVVQPWMQGDTKLQSEISPTLKNAGKTEESLVPGIEQENSPEATPAPSNSVFSSPTSTTPPAVSTNLLQRNVTRDESFHPNQDVPQLPTVLENLVGSRHVMPLIQPLNQPSQFLTAASTAESSREQPTVLQAMPETSPRRVQSAAPLPLSEEIFSNASEATVQVPPVSLDTQPLTLRRFATDVTHGTTPEPNQHTQPLGSSTPTSDIPTSWSSIAELLGDNTDDSSSTFGSVTSIQRTFDNSREQAPLDWQESNSWESIIPEYSRSTDSSSTFNQETPIQRFTTEEAPPHEEVSSAEHPSKQEDSKNEDSNSLEMLALEIYGLVRQRLEIERERHGNYYSDRLPW